MFWIWLLQGTGWLFGLAAKEFWEPVVNKADRRYGWLGAAAAIIMPLALFAGIVIALILAFR